MAAGLYHSSAYYLAHVLAGAALLGCCQRTHVHVLHFGTVLQNSWMCALDEVKRLALSTVPFTLVLRSGPCARDA